MNEDKTLGQALREQGVSRRGFLKFCATTASLMALSPAMVPAIARALENARRPSVIWLSFQECTGCTESLTRSHAPTVEGLIFDSISLDYHHTLQAASGHAAEAAREAAMETHRGEYLLVSTEIETRRRGRPYTIAVDYLLRRAEGTWRTFDVVTDGVGLVENYRAQFNKIIARDGFDGLIGRMRKKRDK